MKEQQPAHYMNETEGERIKRLEIMVNYYRNQLAKEMRKNHELQKQQK